MKNKERSVLDKIFAVYDNLYEAEKKIADYVINNQEKVVDMTVSELAAKSNVSEATIIRFCKKCNLKGFHHLKISLAKEMVTSEESKISNTLDINNISGSIQNILANKIEELKQTVSMMDEKEVKTILETIKKARIVQFAAVGNTIPIILDGAYKLNQIGIRAVANSIWENQLAFSYSLTEEDVLIAVSSTGSSKRILTLVDVANEKGATTICITNHESSPLASKCKYRINTSTRERLFLDEFAFSKLSTMAVIEILFLLLAVDKRDGYTCISSHEQSMVDDKF